MTNINIKLATFLEKEKEKKKSELKNVTSY